MAGLLSPRCVLETELYPGTRPGSAEDVDLGEQLRLAGNDMYHNHDILGAVAKYSDCLALSPSNYLALGNRSACWLRWERYDEALGDAVRCVALNPRYAKGYLRRGAAEWKMGRVADARASYEDGLRVDPRDERLLREYRKVAARDDSSFQGAARAAMLRTMGTPGLDVEGLFLFLQDPERLTPAAIEQRALKFDALLEYFARTLECDLVVLMESPPMREAYDRATFAAGQLLSAAPGPVSRLRNAKKVVSALRHAMRVGWKMEPDAKSHGVSKFAANALAIVATARDAQDDVRRLATRHLLYGMLDWLLDATPEPDLDRPPPRVQARRVPTSPPRDDDAEDTDEDDIDSSPGWVVAQTQTIPTPVPLPVPRDENGIPTDGTASRGLIARLAEARKIQVDDDLEDVEDVDFFDDDSSLEDDEEEEDKEAREVRDRRRREEREQFQQQRVVCGCGALSPRLSAATWLERLFERGAPSWVKEECEAFADAEIMAMHLCVVVRDERAPPLGLPGFVRCVARKLMRSSMKTDLFVRPEWRWDAAIRVAVAGQPHSKKEDDSKAEPGETDAALALRLQQAFDDEAIRRSRTEPRLPPRRIGEWLAASIGYLILFVDGDELFAAHACAALDRLAAYDATRVAQGLWAGVPLLEKLSALACKDTHAVALMENLARDCPGARSAMLSLAAALAGGTDIYGSGVKVDPPQLETASGMAAQEELTQRFAEYFDSFDDDGGDDTPAADAAPAERSPVEAITALEEAQVFEQLSEDGNGAAPTPSWAEYFHELRGTLGIGSGRSESDEMVLLANFERAARELPIAGELRLSRANENLEFSAVPAAWNERCADTVEAADGLCGDPSAVLGSPEWRASVRPRSCVLVERSAIRRSPAAPDWASAVRLCADAGAVAAVVVNDLLDDGHARPAFRMGVFGAAPPAIAAFMVSGKDGERLRKLFPGTNQTNEWRVDVRTIRNEHIDDSIGVRAGRSESLLRSAPTWPLRGVPRDVAQAWALTEVVSTADPASNLKVDLATLADKMEAAEKRVWLARRLQRYHRARALRGGDPADESSPATTPAKAAVLEDEDHKEELPEEEDDDEDDDDEEEVMELDEDSPLAFVECDRDSSNQLADLRRQLRDGVGLGAPDITGEFEVRFKNETAVGSAVVREWMDVAAHRGFIAGGGCLLCTKDHGRSFVPNVAACFVNKFWAADFELLGRLIGLALWQQVTLDLPLHPVVCEALLNDGDVVDGDLDRWRRLLKSLDPDLERSLQWIDDCDDPDSLSAIDLPFTDAIDPDEFKEAAETSASEEENSSSSGENDDDDDEGPERRHQKQRQRRRRPEEEPSSKGGEPRVLNLDRDGYSEVLDMALSDEDLKERADVSRTPPGSRVELIEGGDSKVVTVENKAGFVKAMIDWRLRQSLRGPLRAMARGLHATVPSSVLQDAKKMLTPVDLARLVSGLRDVDVADFKRHTRFGGGLRPDAVEVTYFWETIDKWAQTDKNRLHDLLQFATGSRRVPVGGFAHLVGLNGGKHPFTLSSGAYLPPGALPTAHACICTVDLPKFRNAETAQAKLLAAVRLISTYLTLPSRSKPASSASMNTPRGTSSTTIRWIPLSFGGIGN